MAKHAMDHETKILIGLIGLFSIITVGTLAFRQPPVVIAVSVSLVVTACLYRFLGGVEGSRLVVASFRAGGSVAVFGAAVWFINDALEARYPVVIPERETWVVIDERGLPVNVRVGQDEAGPDASEFLRDVTWDVKRDADVLRITAGDGEHDLAKVRLPPALSSLGLVVGTAGGDGLRYTDDLEEGMEADLYPPYPYRIRADRFGGERNGFSVLNMEGDSVIASDALRSKSFMFFHHEGKHFLVFVSRAVHNEGPPRAAFGFAQLDLTIDLETIGS